MKQKITVFQNRGMTRDISISKQNHELAYENFNIRITAKDHDSLLSVTNERGNVPIDITDENGGGTFSIHGSLIGYSVLNSYLVLFTKDTNNDHIYRIFYNDSTDTWSGTVVYTGNLQFDINHPIETLSNYESEDIQKVYWVDGINQPRFVNISDKSLEFKNTFRKESFDFITTFSPTLSVDIEKDYQGNGLYTAGTVQYVFSYYMKFGQQTNIVYKTDLNYISYKDRGGAADSSVPCQFILTISGMDTRFDYLRIYSIVRTSEDTTPAVNLIAELATGEGDTTIIDNGTVIEAVDPTLLLFIGGREISAGTMAAKDNTLFLGDLKLLNKDVDSNIKEFTDSFINKDTGESSIIEFVLSDTADSIQYPSAIGYYAFRCQLEDSSSEIRTFKGGEKYRFALQFITNTGQRSSAYWIGDKTNSLYPKIDTSGSIIRRPVVECRIQSQGLISYLKANDYVSVCLLMAEVTNADRSIIAQGFVSSTLFNLEQRYNNAPYSLASWYTRFKNSAITNTHFACLPANNLNNCEIQSTAEEAPPYMSSTELEEEYIVERSYTLQGWVKYNFMWLHQGRINVIETITYSSGRTENPNYLTSIRENFWNLAEDVVNYLKNQGYTSTQRPSKTYIRDCMYQSLPGQTNLRKQDIVWTKSASTVDYYGPFPVSPYSSEARLNYINNYRKNYYVDESIVTFNSPELTADTIDTIDNSNYKFRIVGMAVGSSNITDYDFTVESPLNSGYSRNLNFDFNTVNTSDDVSGLLTFPLYADAGKNDWDSDVDSVVGYLIYPWHKEGSISGRADETTGEQLTVLKNKKEANLRFCYLTDYMWTGADAWNPPNGIEQLRVFNTDETSLVQLQVDGLGKTYQGNYDYLISSNMDGVSNKDGYSLFNTGTMSPYTLKETLEEQMSKAPNYSGAPEDTLPPDEALEDISDSEGIFPFNYRRLYFEDGEPYTDYIGCFDPVRISFKESPHAIISFRRADGRMVILPRLDTDAETVIPDGVFLPWTEIDQDVQDEINNARYLIVPSDTVITYSIDENDILTDPEGNFMEQYNSMSGIPLMILTLTGLDEYHLYKIDSAEYVEITLTPVEGLVGNAEKLEEGVKITAAWTGPEHATGYSVVIEKKNEDSYDNILTETVTEEFIEYTYAEGTDSDVYRVTVTALGNGENYLDSQPVFTEDIVIGTASGSAGISLTAGGPVQIKITYSEVLESGLLKAFHTGNYYNFTVDETGKGSITSYSLPTVQSVQDILENSLKNVSGNFEYNYIFIGEIYREFQEGESDSRYGGISEAAIENNVFIPISKDFPIQNSTVITGTEGDTFFQRWDCVKTYPFNDEHTNSIVDMVSLMLETHTNIEGRTDIRRGLMSNIGTTPDSIDTVNPIYSQRNNFFTSNVLDDKFQLSFFPSQITWTKTKTPTEEIDSWTNITLTSTLDLDGDKGPVRALRRFQNSLVSFQDSGIAEILFNTRTQLSTMEGVPIEIANSGKVDGKRYITNKSGCINKWSIVETARGIYFIDNINSSISLFSGEIQSLSDLKGFKDWIGRNNSTELWTPENYDNFIAYWDRVNDDVYFLKDNIEPNQNTLCYNEQIQQFVSFYDYGHVPMMVNVKDRFVSFKNNRLWLQGEGLYSNIFGDYQNFYVTYRVTPEPYGDKIFTNLEYRADIFDMNTPDEFMGNEGTLTGETFDKLKVWNEFQGNEINLSFPVKDSYPDNRRKFRIWRTDIPRDRKNKDNPFGLNRIRNPWIYLKLEKDNTAIAQDSNLRMELHDIMVKYFE